MRANKKAIQLARQLFNISLVNGSVSQEAVTRVLAHLEGNPPPHLLAVLRRYQVLVTRALARNHASVEHAGPLSEASRKLIEASLSKHYNRPISSSAKANPALIAGLRIRIGDDLIDSSVAGQLAALSNSV